MRFSIDVSPHIRTQRIGVVHRVERGVFRLEQDGFYEFERVPAVAFGGGDER